ncbi:hypothetical protein K8R33_00775 [archaeon]|nr:hypothetical protein [archaeon]
MSEEYRPSFLDNLDLFDRYKGEVGAYVIRVILQNTTSRTQAEERIEHYLANSDYSSWLDNQIESFRNTQKGLLEREGSGI